MINGISLRHYFLIIAIGAVSFLIALISPIEGFLREMFAIPGVIAFISFVVLVIRDHSDYKYSIALQSHQQDFDLASASPISYYVFRKQAKFAEDYINKIIEGYSDLRGKGPSKEVAGLATNLQDIRLKYCCWLTEELEQQLVKVERGLHLIASKEYLLDFLPVGDERTKTLNEIYDLFMRIIGPCKGVSDNEQEDLVLADLIVKLRDLLKIAEFTCFRKKVVEASKFNKVNN